MLEFVIRFCLVVLLLILLVITTIVFCFWFVYLLDAMKRKLISYHKELRCIQKGEANSQQEILVYNSKTEFVKYVFLFCMNLVEWLGSAFGCFSYFLSFTRENGHTEDNNYPNKSIHSFHIIYVDINKEHYNLLIVNSFQMLGNICLITGLILIGSLCMYLAARYAQKSWIKYKSIPYLIAFFLIGEVTIQILASFCSTHIIGSWCDNILFTVAFFIVYKQYRKLCMVINWSIVDLRVSGNLPLLKRQVKMKQTFNKVFRSIWAGIILIIASEFLATIIISSVIILRQKNESKFFLSLCRKSNITSPELYNIIAVLSWVSLTFGIIGGMLFLIPYIGYGLSTMCVILWRLFRGKTGYKTHYQNQLNKPLI